MLTRLISGFRRLNRSKLEFLSCIASYYVPHGTFVHFVHRNRRCSIASYIKYQKDIFLLRLTR